MARPAHRDDDAPTPAPELDVPDTKLGPPAADDASSQSGAGRPRGRASLLGDALRVLLFAVLYAALGVAVTMLCRPRL